jgi:hypothetical protein
MFLTRPPRYRHRLPPRARALDGFPRIRTYVATLVTLAGAAACRSRDASPPVRLDAAPSIAVVVADAPSPPDAALPVAAGKPVPIPTNLVAAGDSTCAAMSDLTIRCWGANDHGQLGNGTTADSAAPVTPAIRAVKDLQLAGATACVLLDDTSVACWGQINWGGHPEDLLLPTGVPGVVGASRIFVLAGRACARLANDSLVCWGNVDARGHFAAGPTYRAPTPVVGLDHIAGLHPSGAFSDDGRLWTWTRDGAPRPVDAAGTQEIATTHDGTLCARLDTGHVACIASTDRCGPHTPPPPPPPPGKPAPTKPTTAPQPKLKNAPSPHASKPTPSNPTHATPPNKLASHAHPRASTAKPIDPASARGEPTDTLGFTSVRQLAFDLGFCVVTDNNLLQCGDGCRKTYPPKLERVVSVVGRCALLKSGTVACFDEVKGNPIPNLIRANHLAVGRAHGCAIAFNNIACWGANDHHQLGPFAFGQ